MSTDISSNSSLSHDKRRHHNLQPLYINAEYMVEKEITAVGEFLHSFITKPLLVNEIYKYMSRDDDTSDAVVGLDTQLDDSVSNIGEYLYKDFHNLQTTTRDDRNCVCMNYQCQQVNKHIDSYILISQWFILSSRIKFDRKDTGVKSSVCIDIYVSQIPLLNELFQKKLTSKDCSILGCPHLPLFVNITTDQVMSKHSKWCEPIRFNTIVNDVKELEFQALAFEARKQVHS